MLYKIHIENTIHFVYNSLFVVLNLLTSVEPYLFITVVRGPPLTDYWNPGTPTEQLVESQDLCISNFDDLKGKTVPQKSSILYSVQYTCIAPTNHLGTPTLFLVSNFKFQHIYRTFFNFTFYFSIFVHFSSQLILF